MLTVGRWVAADDACPAGLHSIHHWVPLGVVPAQAPERRMSLRGGQRPTWQSVSKAFPHGEGGSRVSRKCETDEGLASPYGRGAPAGAERACFTLSVGFAASSPKVGAKGERIVIGGTRAEIFMESRNIRTGFCFGPMRASSPTDSDGRSSKSSKFPSAFPGFLTGIFPAPGRSSPGRHTPAFPGRLRSPG